VSEPWRQSASGVLLDLYVQPGASRSRLVGWHGDRLKVAVAAPPEQGKANAEVLRLLAQELARPLRQVQLQSGETSRQKVVLLAGAELASIKARLAELLPKRS
jgi:uncharacterized protein (TIGR00251 family)